MNWRALTILLLGTMALTFANVLAILYDAEWIKVAIALDSAFIGSLSTYYLSGSFQNKQS